MSKEEKQQDEAQEEVKEQPSAASEEAKAPSAPKESKPRRTKVTKMSLEEVERALKVCEETMGGYNSAHARSLLERKAVLASRHSSSSLRKAA